MDFSRLIGSLFLVPILSSPGYSTAMQNNETLAIAVLVDESGSMSMKQDWISRLVSGVDEALSELPSTPQIVTFTVAGFGERSNMLAYETTAAAAARAVHDLRTAGAVENGLGALIDILESHQSENRKLVVLLVTDEGPNDTVNHDVNVIAQRLIKTDVILHALVSVKTTCPYPFLAVGLIAPDRPWVYPENARCSTKKVYTVDTYVDLAFASGGSVWNLDYIRRKQSPMNPGADRQFATFVDILAHDIHSSLDTLATRLPERAMDTIE